MSVLYDIHYVMLCRKKITSSRFMPPLLVAKQKLGAIEIGALL